MRKEMCRRKMLGNKKVYEKINKKEDRKKPT
jgi:hypothetical protein